MGRVIFLATLLLACSSIQAQTSVEQTASKSNYNWKIATLGGTQFWTDVRVEGGWRIQRNSYFGHFRLLNDQDTRQAWGDEAACTQELDRKLKSGVVKADSGKVVILLHGLCRSWKSMEKLAAHLESQGYTAICFRYASSREQVSQHAHYLERVIRELPPNVTEINFVGHSLGNIVVRHYVADCAKSPTVDLDPRINRMVMIGPPNQGSRMARMLKDSVAFKLIAGASGAQLSLGWEELSKNLATPEFEFGIVAGGDGEEGAFFNNILLAGEDDFTVSKRETMLPGADDFLVRPLLHSTMMHQKEVLDATTLFLKNGYFLSNELKQPIDSLPQNLGGKEAK